MGVLCRFYLPIGDGIEPSFKARNALTHSPFVLLLACCVSGLPRGGDWSLQSALEGLRQLHVVLDMIS